MRVFALIGSLSLMLAVTGTAKAECPRELVGIAASIELVLPFGAGVAVRDQGGRDRFLRKGDCLRPGDVLTVPRNVVRVEVFDGGDQAVTLTWRSPPWKAPGSLVESYRRVKSYLEAIMAGLPPGQRTTWGGLTAVRGESVPLRVALEASQGTTQLIAPELSGGRLSPPWRNGTGPWVCDIDDVAQANIAQDGQSPDCDMVAPASFSRLSIHDAKRKSLTWQVSRVDPAQVPRPPWLKGVERPSPEEGVAWGLWLIDDPQVDGSWILQGYDMVAANRSASWLTGMLYARLRDGGLFRGSCRSKADCPRLVP